MNAATSATAGKPGGTPQSDGDATTSLDLDQIQGNLVGFNKPFQCFLFLKFERHRRRAALGWLHDVVGTVTTGQDVLTFRRHRKKALADGRIAEATWRNLAFTHAGLEVLGTLLLSGLPDDFVDGMAARAERLGDKGEGAPGNWIFNTGGKQIHAVMLLAADSAGALRAEVAQQIQAIEAAGIRVLHCQPGNDPPEAPGTEHFGFKDGVSQPDLRDGGIIIGCPQQSAATAIRSTARDQWPPPEWTRNGSYLVFRRLRQDVGGFRTFVREQAGELGISEELLMAKLLGRYRSGAPLAEFASSVGGSAKTGVLGQRDDPGFDPAHGNDFGYRYDPDGLVVPRAAHIRKANPRDQGDPDEDEVRRRRILRRGIPFGPPYAEGVPDDADGRGLLFISYQRSIAEQFEFVQGHWANNPNFPRVGQGNPPGYDPIIGQAEDGQGQDPQEFDLTGSPHSPINLLPRWVTMTGGDYFFSPSIKALYQLAMYPGKERDPMGGPGGYGHGAERYVSDGFHGQAVSIENGGAGLCSVLITVGIGVPDDYIKPPSEMWRARWAVLVDDVPVWTSRGRDQELCVTKQGILVGKAELSVRQLLEALPRETTVGQILDAAASARSVYQSRLRLVVYLDGGKALSLPIDMSISPW